jgi:hypothetical protein
MTQRHRPELADAVSADPLGSYRRTPRTFGRDRTCALPGCLTVLSIYNSSKHCAAHGARHLRVTPAAAPDSTLMAAPYLVADDGGGPKTNRSRGPVLVEPAGEVTRQAS